MAEFLLNSILLGIGLTMDAFTVSIANTLQEPRMKRKKQLGMAGMYGLFQALMPLTGWFCVHTIVTIFEAFTHFIPWIALALLCWIGGKMVRDGIRDNKDPEMIEEKESGRTLTLGLLLTQAVATSIDALSVGFAIAAYSFAEALVCSLIIATVTFFVCMGGARLGKKVGLYLAGKATVVGGCILIGIGLEIWISGLIEQGLF